MKGNPSRHGRVNVVLRAFAVQAEGLKHYSPGAPGSAGAKGVVIPFPCQALKGRDRCFALPKGPLRGYRAQVLFAIRTTWGGAQARFSQAVGLLSALFTWNPPQAGKILGKF